MDIPSHQAVDWDRDELDRTLLDFSEIQAELNYKQAQESLQHQIEAIDLTPREQNGLEAEIDRLTKMLDKLDRSVVQIAAFGMVGRGKSSVLNALLGENAFTVGPLHGVTQTVGSANWQLEEEAIEASQQSLQRLSLAGVNDSQIQLLDTPGIDEVDGKTREILAKKVAKQVDLILFVIAGDIAKVEYEALSQLRDSGKPMILVFNKIDQYPEADREEIYRTIRDRRVRQLLSPEEIVMVAASPLVAEKVENIEGKVSVQRRRGKPCVEALKLKILDILHREGKALLALNTMLYADEVNEQIVRRKMEIRNDAANATIMRGVMTKAIAIALNPVTVVDLFTGAIIDLALILSLSHLYGIPMTQQGAFSLLQKIALSMGGISASELLGTLGLSGIKGLLGISAPVTAGISLLPYVSVAIAQAGVAGVSSYAIGQVTKTYLANGATWGPDGPKVVVQNILDSLDETSILNRIKEELTAKLSTNNYQ
ncbi:MULTISPECIES: GTP-binding protein [Spirulina sp. CCY15215]|uniref:GTP-binding protein n=1 Tax=Spirulina sp. CCY15215 TaxID=2767591 RepID=UPI00194F51C4|nr:GTP-binding protein [Spirulina major]